MRLQGKQAFVTGGRQGIGRGIVEAFLREGAEVSASGRTERPDDLDNRVRWFQFDVTDAETVEATGAVCKGTDILVNNAGVQVEKTVPQTSDADWDLVMGANAKGVFNMCRAFIPHMSKAGRSSILVLFPAMSPIHPWRFTMRPRLSCMA